MKLTGTGFIRTDIGKAHRNFATKIWGQYPRIMLNTWQQNVLVVTIQNPIRAKIINQSLQ